MIGIKIKTEPSNDYISSRTRSKEVPKKNKLFKTMMPIDEDGVLILDDDTDEEKVGKEKESKKKVGKQKENKKKKKSAKRQS